MCKGILRVKKKSFLNISYYHEEEMEDKGNIFLLQ